MPVVIHGTAVSCRHRRDAAPLHAQQKLYVRRSYGMTGEDVCCGRSSSCLPDPPQSTPQAGLVVCSSTRVKNAQEAAPARQAGASDVRSTLFSGIT